MVLRRLGYSNEGVGTCQKSFQTLNEDLFDDGLETKAALSVHTTRPRGVMAQTFEIPTPELGKNFTLKLKFQFGKVKKAKKRDRIELVGVCIKYPLTK